MKERSYQELEQELAQRERELLIISQTVRTISQELELNRVLPIIAEQARELIQAGTLVVPIIDRSGEHYTYLAASGENAELIIGQSFPIRIGMCGWVLTHQQPLFWGQDSVTLMGRETRWEHGMESALLVPLLSRGKIIGGLSGLGRVGGGSFTDKDLSLLELFADHISIAIENAQIFTELKEEKERAVVTLKSIGDAVIVTNTQGLVAQMNRVAEQLTGWTEAEAQGRKLSEVFEIVHAETRAPVSAPVEAVLSSGHITDLASHTVLVNRRQGEFHIADSAAPIRDSANRVIGVVLVFRDISQEYALQATLHAQQQQQQAILDNTPAVVYVKDKAGKYLFINRQFETLFHVVDADVRGKTDFDLFDRRFAEHFHANDLVVLETGKVLEVEESAPQDGGVHTYLSIKFPLLDEKGLPYAVCGISTDITEHRRAEDSLRRSQKMDAMGQLSGGIAHDFNNQLGIIIGYLDMLKMSLEGNVALSEWLSTASKATLRCIELAQQLLSFSRKQPLNAEVVDLNACIEDMKVMIARALTPQIVFMFRPQPELWPVNCNKGDFQDSLLNLVINARDAMEKGGTLVVSTTNIDVDPGQAQHLFKSMRPGRYVCISITDTGAGMSREVLEHIFEPYFTTKPKGKGTGLGMAMVYGFSERYRGKIRIYSEPGMGTSVHLYLPSSDGQEVRETLDAPLETRLPRGSEKILIVDDEPDLLGLARHYLNDLGYATLAAHDGPAALEALIRNPDVDLLFSDIIMPGGMNGAELAAQAQAMRPGLKILLSSGFIAENINHDMLGDYARHLLIKPYRKDVLARQVRNALDEK